MGYPAASQESTSQTGEDGGQNENAQLSRFQLCARNSCEGMDEGMDGSRDEFGVALFVRGLLVWFSVNTVLSFARFGLNVFSFGFRLWV